MKKFTFLLFSIFVAFISCSQNPELDSELKTGTITGYALYQNGNDSADINILLEASDGLQTTSFRGRSAGIVKNTTTDSDGYYKIEEVPEGVYTLYAASQDSTEKAVKTSVIVVDGETIEVETLNLTVTGKISGTITYEESEDQNYGFVIYIAGTSYSAMTEKDGSFTISGIPAGTGYNLVISKGSFTYYWKTDVEVPALDTITFDAINFTEEEIQAALMNEKGEDGKDGTPIIWKGSFASPNELRSPEYLWAYFNTSDGCSYIYDGTAWTLLAKAGKKGEDGAILSKESYILSLEIFNASFEKGAEVPDYYLPGTKVILPKVVSSTKEFAGWFSDSDYSTQCPDVIYDSDTGNYIYSPDKK